MLTLSAEVQFLQRLQAVQPKLVQAVPIYMGSEVYKVHKQVTPPDLWLTSDLLTVDLLTSDLLTSDLLHI